MLGRGRIDRDDHGSGPPARSHGTSRACSPGRGSRSSRPLTYACIAVDARRRAAARRSASARDPAAVHEHVAPVRRARAPSAPRSLRRRRGAGCRAEPELRRALASLTAARWKRWSSVSTSAARARSAAPQPRRHAQPASRREFRGSRPRAAAAMREPPAQRPQATQAERPPDTEAVTSCARVPHVRILHPRLNHWIR